MLQRGLIALWPGCLIVEIQIQLGGGNRRKPQTHFNKKFCPSKGSVGVVTLSREENDDGEDIADCGVKIKRDSLTREGCDLLITSLPLQETIEYV
jgi:hypothetical protein